MSTADLAVIAVTVLGLANVWATYRVHIRVIAMLGDRLRVAAPAKAAQDDGKDAGGQKAPKIPDITTGGKQ